MANIALAAPNDASHTSSFYTAPHTSNDSYSHRQAIHISHVTATLCIIRNAMPKRKPLCKCDLLLCVNTTTIQCWLQWYLSDEELQKLFAIKWIKWMEFRYRCCRQLILFCCRLYIYNAIWLDIFAANGRIFSFS